MSRVFGGINPPPQIKVSLIPQITALPVVFSEHVDAGDCACAGQPNAGVKELVASKSKNAENKPNNLMAQIIVLVEAVL